MTKEEFEKKRRDLLNECIDVREALYKKACAEGRAGVGLGRDLPEIRAVTEEYRQKAILLQKEYEES